MRIVRGFSGQIAHDTEKHSTPIVFLFNNAEEVKRMADHLNQMLADPNNSTLTYCIYSDSDEASIIRLMELAEGNFKKDSDEDFYWEAACNMPKYEEMRNVAHEYQNNIVKWAKKYLNPPPVRGVPFTASMIDHGAMLAGDIRLALALSVDSPIEYGNVMKFFDMINDALRRYEDGSGKYAYLSPRSVPFDGRNRMADYEANKHKRSINITMERIFCGDNTPDYKVFCESIYAAFAKEYGIDISALTSSCNQNQTPMQPQTDRVTNTTSLPPSKEEKLAILNGIKKELDELRNHKKQIESALNSMATNDRVPMLKLADNIGANQRDLILRNPGIPYKVFIDTYIGTLDTAIKEMEERIEEFQF